MKLISALILVLVLSPLQARDITKKVFRHSNYDERASNACSGRCGNRGWSRIESIEVKLISDSVYDAQVRATVKYHQYSPAPELFGIQFEDGINIEYQINIIANGDLDAITCKLTVTKVDIHGDHLNILRGAQNQVGRIHSLQNCPQYLY
ncbi:MAG: hypothetical protein ACI845_003066 [Gammaproteobacteria bacterium]|jgi:hypothetical protein